MDSEKLGGSLSPPPQHKISHKTNGHFIFNLYSFTPRFPPSRPPWLLVGMITFMANLSAAPIATGSSRPQFERASERSPFLSPVVPTPGPRATFSLFAAALVVWLHIFPHFALPSGHRALTFICEILICTKCRRVLINCFFSSHFFLPLVFLLFALSPSPLSLSPTLFWIFFTSVYFSANER